VLHPEIRDNVPEVARTFFPRANPAAEEELARLSAGLGERPSPQAPASVHLEYLEFLADMERFDDLANYLSSTRLSAATLAQAELKLVELWARAGRLPESEALRGRISPPGTPLADLAALAQFRGRIEARQPIVVRENTFARLPIEDPSVLAQAMMEWSLTPNRAIRGAAPWDQVVLRFLPGFDNLPLPEDDEVAAAAAASPMY
jgi:hypothetical protein